MTQITPRLIVSDATRAITFYSDVFRAFEQERYATSEGRIVHAAITIGRSVIALTDEAPEWHNHSPSALGGSPVLLTLECDDPGQRMLARRGVRRQSHLPDRRPLLRASRRPHPGSIRSPVDPV
jgi:uncharacterized glyoxalase superfamily protein PhnB